MWCYFMQVISGNLQAFKWRNINLERRGNIVQCVCVCVCVCVRVCCVIAHSLANGGAAGSALPGKPSSRAI